MNIASYLACVGKDCPSLLVIGLGGGGLCTFMQKFLPKALIKSIDIDEDMLKIATDWFGFHQSDKLTVDILDGTEFLAGCIKTGIKSVLITSHQVKASCPITIRSVEHKTMIRNEF